MILRNYLLLLRKHRNSVAVLSKIVVFKDIRGIYFENHMKLINKLCRLKDRRRI